MPRIAWIFSCLILLACFIACSGGQNAPAPAAPLQKQKVKAEPPAGWRESIAINGVKVTITHVSVSKVPMADGSESFEAALWLRLLVLNLSKETPIEFDGWVSGNAEAIDNHGKVLLPHTFLSRPKNDESATTIKPDDSARAIVAFSQPIYGTKFVVVSLAGEAVGLVGKKYEWIIDQSAWANR